MNSFTHGLSRYLDDIFTEINPNILTVVKTNLCEGTYVVKG